MLLPDTIIHNRYRIIYAIDDRSGSKVFRARDDQTGGLVLVAALPYEDDAARTDIELLARQVAAARHESILPLVEHFAEQGAYYLVCDNPAGQDIDRTLRSRGGPLPETDTLVQARRLLDGLDFLHSQRPPIYLGDPGASDLWVGEDGTWRLVPFALVRSIDRGPSPYRAPELEEHEAEPENPSDLYAVGALLYHALTGWAPPTPAQQQAGTPLNGPRVLNPALSTLAEQVLLRALQLRPSNRYQTAREMRLAIEMVQMMDGRSLGLGPDVKPTASEQPPSAPPAQPQPVSPAGALAGPPVPPASYPPPGSAAPTGAYPPPGTYPQGAYPPPPGIYPAPEPQRRGLRTGCLIVIAVVLTLLMVVICAGLVLLWTGNLPRLLSGASGLSQFATVAPATPGTTPTAATTTAPTAPPTAAAQPTAAASTPAAAATSVPITLGPDAITLLNAEQITQTEIITSPLFGPVAYSPDGKTLAVGVDNNINLRNASTLDDIRKLTGHISTLTVIVWSPDSSLLASGAMNDNDIYIWDAGTGRLLRKLTGHTGWIRSLAFAPDGKTLASGSMDMTVRLWDPATRTLQQTLSGHTAIIGGVGFAPDGATLASTSRDGTVRLWDVASGQPHTGFAFETALDPDPIEPATPHYWTTGVAFAPDGKSLAVGATDGVVYLLDPATGKEQQQLRGHTNWVIIRGIQFTPDGKTLATASLDGTIRLWNPATGVSSGELVSHQLQLLGISISPDGKSIASTSDEAGQLLLWDVATQKPTNSLQIGQGLITSLAFSPDGDVLGTLGYNSTLRLHEIGSPRSRMLSGTGLSTHGVLFLPNDTIVTVTDQNSIIRIKPGEQSSETLEGLDGSPTGITMSRDGKVLAAGTNTGRIALWDADTGAARASVRSGLRMVYALALNDDGTYAAAAGPPDDPQIEIWNLRTGNLEQTLTGATSAIIGLAFQPGTTLVAAAELRGGVGFWDITDGKLVKSFSASATQGGFAGMAFTPDGSILATSSPNGQVVLRDAKTSQVVRTIQLTQGGALALAFSPDGERLAISVRDSTVRIFELPKA